MQVFSSNGDLLLHTNLLLYSFRMYLPRIAVLSLSLVAPVGGFIQWLSATTTTPILRPFRATSSVQDLPPIQDLPPTSETPSVTKYDASTQPGDIQSSFFFCPFESFGVPTGEMVEKKKRPLLLYLPGEGRGVMYAARVLIFK